MKKALLALLTVVSMSVMADVIDTPTDRVLQFLTNIHTGKRMDAKAWLLKDARNGERFKAYGGLDAVVKQTTSLAHEYQGIRAIELKTVSPTETGFIITTEVRFLDDERRKKSPAIAERDDMIWRFRVEKESGIWKLAF
jgi:hypothetical protein